MLLSGAIWLALPPSNWRSIAKFCMISTGLLYVLLAFFLISFICLFPQRPNKEIRLKNGDTISVGYNDQGAMGGNVSVWRERPYGPFFFKLESRTLGWCDPEFITLPDGKELISITGEEPMAIDEFFQSNGKRR